MLNHFSHHTSWFCHPLCKETYIHRAALLLTSIRTIFLFSLKYNAYYTFSIAAIASLVLLRGLLLSQENPSILLIVFADTRFHSCNLLHCWQSKRSYLLGPWQTTISSSLLSDPCPYLPRLQTCRRVMMSYLGKRNSVCPWKPVAKLTCVFIMLNYSNSYKSEINL